MNTRKKSTVQSEIEATFLAGLETLVVTAKAGGVKAVKRKHTLRTAPLKQFELPAIKGSVVVGVRKGLGVSQPVFAKILGVSPQSVKAWEQGTKPPSGSARRLIDEMRRNPQYWRERFELNADTPQ